MMSEETKRKISESLKAFYAGRGSVSSKTEKAVASVKSGARSTATTAENKVRSAYAKLTPSKVDDFTTAVGNVRRSTGTAMKNAGDKAKAEISATKRGLKEAAPMAAKAARSLKADALSAKDRTVTKAKATGEAAAKKAVGTVKEKVNNTTKKFKDRAKLARDTYNDVKGARDPKEALERARKRLKP